MNRGLISGIKQLFIPPSLGGGDSANDGALLGFDSTQPGGIKPVPNGTYAPPAWQQALIMLATPSSVVQGTWLTAANSTAYLNGYTYNSTGAQNDGAIWTTSLSPGTWSLDMFMLTNTLYGIATIDFSTDSGATFTPIGTVDCYAASFGPLKATLTGIVIPAGAAKVLLRVRVLAKNAASTGFTVLCSAALFTRTV